MADGMTIAKRGLTKSKMALYLAGALLVFYFGWGLYVDHVGPTATEAFRKYVKDPIPLSVSNIRIRHNSHLNGRNIYLVFEIAPPDVEGIIRERKLKPADSLRFPIEISQSIDPGAPITREGGDFYSRHKGPIITSLAVSKDCQKAYFWYTTDSDYASRPDD